MTHPIARVALGAAPEQRLHNGPPPAFAVALGRDMQRGAALQP
jgi:hypothetical protein